MKTIDTEILVMGGGATGTGVARDAAMRGFKTVLVEKNDLSQGTTGRFHGLLHSGGRYVVKDPEAAVECIEENRILRKIMPFCLEDTGGYFVSTPYDDPDFAEQFLAGCLATGVPVEEIPVAEMLRAEPLLNPQIRRCFQVPDASADSFLATDANAESARQYGAQILPYHPVIDILRDGARVTGARCLDRLTQEELVIRADLVINASGAWAGRIAQMVGVPVEVVPGKGTMVAINHRVLHTVVNRCKRPSDADIIVPAHTVAVIGTTDVAVADPDHYSIEPWEVRLMLEEGEKLIPGLKQMRMLRAWAGVRPLYKGKATADHADSNRDISRSYVLLDHETRDGLSGFLTITGGKWTTYRQMAQVTLDTACRKLGVQRECRTHLESLPEPRYLRQARSSPSFSGSAARTPAGDLTGEGEPRMSSISPLSPEVGLSQEQGLAAPPVAGASLAYHRLGARLAAVEAGAAYGDLICECELASYQDVARSILEGQARTIDDVRRDVRLGMGPCQGGFCTLRVAGVLHALTRPAVETTNAALRDYLQERWKGLVPVLWGQQLRQERLNELIYLSLLNTDHLPGPQRTEYSSASYVDPDPAGWEGIPPAPTFRSAPPETTPMRSPAEVGLRPPTHPSYYDALVVGAGLAGLSAALQISRSGQRVHVIAKGWGSNYWHAGAVDVLGYTPIASDLPLESPEQALRDLIATQPEHPYARVGLDGIARALEAFQEVCASAGYPLSGSLERNHLLPAATGAIRPTCLAPLTMLAGDLRSREAMLLVGFEKYRDFYPEMAAANLTAQGIPASALTLDLPFLSARNFVYSRTLADFFDLPEYRRAVVAALRPHLKGVRRVGFPAVLGLAKPLEVLHDLEAQLEMPVFEIPVLPASIPGVRLTLLLIAAIRAAGGRVHEGMLAVGSRSGAGSLTHVLTETASRPKTHTAQAFILATGGILGGGIQANFDGLVREVICDTPVTAPRSRAHWSEKDFLSPAGHPIFRAGIRVDPAFHPAAESGEPVFDNLYAAGAGLAGGEYIRERSYDGVAIATGFAAAQQLLGDLKTTLRRER